MNQPTTFFKSLAVALKELEPIFRDDRLLLKGNTSRRLRMSPTLARGASGRRTIASASTAFGARSPKEGSKFAASASG
jgi:hypothetical protein